MFRKWNMRALASKGASPEATDREKPKAGMPEDGLAAQDSRSKLFRFSGPRCLGAESSSKRSWYYSARIQRMIDGGGMESEDEVFRIESEIESSRDHWSEVTPAVSGAEQSGETNREYWEMLKRRKYSLEGDELVFEQIPEDGELGGHWSLFNDFINWGDRLVVGEKLAEGGQAEIYAATGVGGTPMVLKVFKGGSVLQHLDKQFPPALLKWHQWDSLEEPDSPELRSGLRGATLLKDERFKDRFAFVMRRAWGDLRKLIDQRMMHSSHNQGPPFPLRHVMRLMYDIAHQMKGLHGQRPPILHNDLKAANVLVRRDPSKEIHLWTIEVADFECSVGVVGTGFWRAPEILQQLKDRVSISNLKFSKKCDVYSYGMTCYELVTGRMPFEDYVYRPGEGCNLVLKGIRPELPPSLDPLVEGIITSCWHPIPLERPSFEDITMNLQRIMK